MKQNSNNGKPDIKDRGPVWHVKIGIPTGVSEKSIQVFRKSKNLKLKVILN